MTAAQFSQITLTPWRQGQFFSFWGRWLIGGLLVLTSVGSLIWLPPAVGWRVPLGILLVTLHGAWLALAASLQQQNHPHAARCVPGHLSALRRSALLAWALCSAVTTLLSLAILPSVISWQLQLLVNSLLIAFLLWTTRVWWLWLGLAFYGPLLGAFRKTLEPLLLAAYSVWQAQTDTVLVLALLAQVALVMAAFGRGDARHRKAYERQRQMLQLQRLQLEGKTASHATAFGRLDGFGRPFAALLSAWRRHVVERADNNRPGSVLARAELVLHGNNHWTHHLLTLVCIAAVVAASLALVLTFTSVSAAQLLQHGAFGMGIGLASMGVNPALARPQSLWQTRREQALLRLLPGMPQGAALNRAVAWLGLRHALLACLLTGAALLPLAAWAAQTLPLLWLPIMAVPWSVWTATRAPARLPAPTPLTAVLPVFAFYLSAFIGHVACTQLELPMAALALPVLAASALWGLWRWHGLATQPAALPAGRLA